MPKKTPSKPPERPKKKPRKPTFSSRQLTKHLRELAAEAYTFGDDDSLITRGEALADLLWKKALGYTEIQKKDDGSKVEIYHKPESWAMQLIWDRMEGKAPIAIPDEKGRQTVATKVDELERSRINSMSEAALALSGAGDSVDGPDHRAEGPQGPGGESGVAGEASGGS